MDDRNPDRIGGQPILEHFELVRGLERIVAADRH